VDLKAARELGLTVTRVPAYSPHAVAEHTVALLLALNRRIHRAYHRVRDHNFSLAGLVGFDLFGKTVGIVGTGKIGRLTAQILRGFGMNVLAYDVQPDADWARRFEVSYTTLPALLAASDVVSLHLPLLPETRHLLREETIAQMKPGALDVYEEEEGLFFEDHSGEVLQDDELTRLLTFPNVLVTSHQAFLTREALTEIARVTTTNLRNFADGTKLLDGTVLAAP